MEIVTRTMAMMKSSDRQEFQVMTPMMITAAEKKPAIRAVPFSVLFFSVSSSRPFRKRLRPFSTPAVKASVLPVPNSRTK